MVFESFGVNVYVDPKSLAYLDGTELDYAREGLNEASSSATPTRRRPAAAASRSRCKSWLETITSACSACRRASTSIRKCWNRRGAPWPRRCTRPLCHRQSGRAPGGDAVGGAGQRGLSPTAGSDAAGALSVRTGGRGPADREQHVHGSGVPDAADELARSAGRCARRCRCAGIAASGVAGGARTDASAPGATAGRGQDYAAAGQKVREWMFVEKLAQELAHAQPAE